MVRRRRFGDAPQKSDVLSLTEEMTKLEGFGKGSKYTGMANLINSTVGATQFSFYWIPKLVVLLVITILVTLFIGPGLGFIGALLSGNLMVWIFIIIVAVVAMKRGGD